MIEFEQDPELFVASIIRRPSKNVLELIKDLFIDKKGDNVSIAAQEEGQKEEVAEESK